jgi:peptide/nickel transport system permease protein
MKKVWHAVVTLYLVLTLNFFLFRVMPGDPVALLTRSRRLHPEDIARLRSFYGLDRPLLTQYGEYLVNTVRGRLGASLHSGRPVLTDIGSRLWPTVTLVGIGTVLATAVGLGVGIRGAWRRGSRFDSGSLYGSLALYSMPEAWLGIMLLLLFGGALKRFPVGGFETGGLTGGARLIDIANHAVLPVLTLALGYVGQYVVVMRSSMVEAMNEPYVDVARAKGVPDRMVRTRHVVPNALLPAFTLILLNLGFVLGGATVIETIFSWPGIGLLTYESINRLDYPMLSGILLLSGGAIIASNLIADVTYGFLDPRVRDA